MTWEEVKWDTTGLFKVQAHNWQHYHEGQMGDHSNPTTRANPWSATQLPHGYQTRKLTGLWYSWQHDIQTDDFILNHCIFTYHHMCWCYRWVICILYLLEYINSFPHVGMFTFTFQKNVMVSWYKASLYIGCQNMSTVKWVIITDNVLQVLNSWFVYLWSSVTCYFDLVSNMF